MSSSNIPPQSLEAEKAVLGGILLDHEAFFEIATLLNPESFYKPSHQKIYEALSQLKNKNEPTDLVTVTNFLKQEGVLEQVGGLSYISELTEHTPSSANILHHAQIVSEKKLIREVIKASQGIVANGYKQDFETASDYLSQSEASIFALSNDIKRGDMVKASELVESSMDALQILSQREGDGIIGVGSGFDELDEMSAGFKESEMIIIAARPSMGKTALLVNITLNALLKEKRSVAFFSIEMSKEQVALRMLSQITKIPLSNLRNGKLAEKSWDILMTKAGVLSGTSLFIDDTAPISPVEIRSKCRKLKAQGTLDMVVIDYLQLMGLNHKVENREREVSEISKQLKSLSKELKVPVIALAQLNRSVENRSDQRPLLSDLRESGSIEQDADLIMMLYRDEYYNKNSEEKGIAELIINKQRNGPTGKVKLGWIPEYGLFTNYIDQDNIPPDRPKGRPSQAPSSQTINSINFSPDISSYTNLADEV